MNQGEFPVSKPLAPSPSRWAHRAWLALGVWGCLLVYFFPVWSSGFATVPGDWQDGRLLCGIINHGYEVMRGRAGLTDLPMFFPLRGTLGYSDTLCFYWVPTAIGRLMHLDPARATTVTLMFFMGLGFLGLYGLMREVFRIRRWLAILSAALFFLSAPALTVSQNSHLQLMSVWLVPPLLWLIGRAFGPTVAGRRLQGPWLAPVCGSALGLFFLNAFYIPWFLTLYLGALGGIVLLGQAWAGREPALRGERVRDAWLPGRPPALRWIWQHRARVALAAGCCLLALIPFFSLYLPVLAFAGGHPFASTQTLLPELRHFISLSFGNWVWAGVNHWMLGGNLAHVELRYGIPPLTMASFLIGGGWMVWRHLRGHPGNPHPGLGAAMGLAVLGCWVLLWRNPVLPLWEWVHALVPGGSVIRAPFRFNLLLALPVVLVIALAMETLLARTRHRLAVPAVAALMTLLLVEQQTGFRGGIPVREILSSQQAAPAPGNLEAFFIDRADPGMRGQMHAFSIAQAIGKPTLGGSSGVIPADHLFLHTGDLAAVQGWLEAHPTPAKVYALDWPSRQWIPIDGTDVMRALSREQPHLIGPKELSQVLGAGWSGPEEWGVWSDGYESVLELTNPDPERYSWLRIETAGAILRGSLERRVILSGEGFPARELKYTPASAEQVLWLPVQGRAQLTLHFRFPDAVVPAEVDPSSWDRRRLALGLRSLRWEGGSPKPATP